MFEIQPTNSSDARARTISGAIVGLLIITAGFVLLGGNLGLIDARYVFHTLGPFVLMILGVTTLLRRRPDQVLMGLILILIGVWGFATQQQWIKIHFWALMGPLFLVLAGGSVVWRAFNRPLPDGVSDANIRSFAVLSGSELRPDVPFEGASLTAVMGGIKLDLFNVPMAPDSAVIDVFTLMGGMEILVPRDWEVTVKVVSLMGACVDKRRLATVPATKHLVIRGVTIMGGIEIKD